MGFHDGKSMTALEWTTDLGEVMFSTFTIPTTHYFGFPMEYPIGPRNGYAINEGALRPFNEGWRFAIGYSMIFLFCVIHFVFQKVTGKLPPIMDNGAAVEQAARTAEIPEMSHKMSKTEIPDSSKETVASV